MGILQEFVTFTEGLNTEKRKDVEKLLRHVIDSYSDEFQLTPEQEAEDLRRALDPNPKYAAQAEIEAICGRPMPS